MYWTTIHFAVGMACAGILTVLACAYTRRGWRWLPVVMTLGGIWAVLPDVPATLRASLGLWAGLGSPALEESLKQVGNVFFFHSILDATARDHTVIGGVVILLLYNLAIALLMVLEKRARLGLEDYGVRRALARRRRQRRTAPLGVASHDPSLPYDSPIIGRVRSSHLARAG